MPSQILFVEGDPRDARLVEEMLRDVLHDSFGFQVAGDLGSAIARLSILQGSIR